MERGMEGEKSYPMTVVIGIMHLHVSAHEGSLVTYRDRDHGKEEI